MMRNAALRSALLGLVLGLTGVAPVAVQIRDCYLELAQAVAKDPAATRGLEALVRLRKTAVGGDLQFDLGRFSDWYPDPNVAKGVLSGLDHVRQASGLDRFVSEMLQDAGKAGSASVTLRYLKRTLPDGSGVTLELPIGSRVLDCRLPDGTNLETKALNWSKYNEFVIKQQFYEMRAQSEPFIQDAIERGARFVYLFDSRMPSIFEPIFASVFGDAAGAVRFVYSE